MPLVSPFFRLPGRWTRRKARRTRMAIQTTVLAVLLLVIIPLYVIYKPPKVLINYFQGRFPEVLFHIQTSKNVVALTIDDAPTEYTREILHVLQSNNATATFFVIGNQVPRREGILNDIIASGSELGNHAMHDEPSIQVPSDVLEGEIQQVDSYINHAYEAVGISRQNRFFRPGSGIFSRRVLDIAAHAGYSTILGSIYPHDPFIKLWRLNAWHITSMLRPGAVIICHDRRPWTLPMLKKVLPEMKRRGYEVVSITRLLEMAKDEQRRVIL